MILILFSNFFQELLLGLGKRLLGSFGGDGRFGGLLEHFQVRLELQEFFGALLVLGDGLDSGFGGGLSNANLFVCRMMMFVMMFRMMMPMVGVK